MSQKKQKHTKKEGIQNQTDQMDQTDNDIRRQLKECEKERDQYLKGWQRQKADFLNYKKQEGKRTENLMASIQRECVLAAIGVYDDFERALKSMPKELDDNEWVRGVVEIKKRFEQFLKQEGVEEIEAREKQFDPELHEAVEQVRAKKKKSGEIVAVVQKGYLIKGRLLRPAKVKVTM